MLKYLNNKLVIVEKDTINKEELLKKMVQAIYENTTLIESKEEFLNKIFEREAIGTTGIGKGIAIPHARCENLKNIVLSLALVKNGLDFNTPDGEKAKLIIMVGAPKDKNSEYLALLSSITKAFREKELRDNITCAGSETEILEILAGYFEN